MKKLSKLAFILISGTAAVTIAANSFYTNTESSNGNTLQAGEYSSGLPPLMITEVYYDPPVASEITREWIEIYNTTDNTIDFQNWSFTTAGWTGTFNSSVSIPSHRFAILAHNENIRSTWGLPASTIIIVSTSWPGTLSNTGDKLELKNPSATTIDAMSYGTNTTIFNPSAGPLAEAHSLERLVLTVDTDTAADWVDNSSPTPDAPHP